MRGITINQTTINVTFTAKQWDLYTVNRDCTEAAKAINKTLEYAVNRGFSMDLVRVHMDDVMTKYSKFGASDSEPQHLLEDILSWLSKEGFPKQNSTHFIKE